MNQAEDEIQGTAKNLDHALEALLAAATVERPPTPVRAQVCGALVAVARVAGLVEALAEGVVVLAPDETAS